MRRESVSRQGRAAECVVQLWRGYVTAQFHAWRPGDDEPFLSSQPFRTWRPPWEPRVPTQQLASARSAFAELSAQLARRGWAPADADDADEHVFARRSPDARLVEPAHIGEHLFLRALHIVAGERGATAAELGEALYGPDAESIHHLPQRIGSRLRSLHLQGKVAREETNGHSHWFPANGAARGNGR